jgi:hypothetical protein
MSASEQSLHDVPDDAIETIDQCEHRVFAHLHEQWSEYRCRYVKMFGVDKKADEIEHALQLLRRVGFGSSTYQRICETAESWVL